MTLITKSISSGAAIRVPANKLIWRRINVNVTLGSVTEFVRREIKLSSN